MKNKLKIEKLKGSADGYCDYCKECNKELVEDGHYVSYGIKYNMKKYHLTCFKRREDKLLTKTNKSVKNIKSNILEMDRFKKHINNKAYKSTKKCNIIKNKFHIKLNDRAWTKSSLSCCKCDDSIDCGEIYILYGSTFNNYFHFQCFQTHANKLLTKWESYKNKLLVYLETLELYSTEMICESL